METIARFEKVSIEEFTKACNKLLPCLNQEDIEKAYEEIRLPRRATKGSAGYDFFTPIDFTMYEGSAFTFPTGIRCKMNDGWVLSLYPRSGMGFKTGVHLANTVGIIDSDYYNSDNEGHIMIKLVTDGVMKKDFSADCGSAVCQGIFLPFGIAEGDDTTEVRNGGFGSTSSN